MSVFSNLLDALTTVVKPAREAIQRARDEGKGLYTMTTSTTPASGSCAVQLVLKDFEGNALTSPVSGTLYLSEVATGLTQDLADTSLAVLTNGALTNIGGAGPSIFTTTAAGLLGLTITAAADSYWVVLVQPDGSLLISDECVVNA
jgi:hypothetical protein